MQHLVKGHQFAAGKPVKAIFGHAVKTAQVAFVCYRQAQVIDLSAVIIYEQWIKIKFNSLLVKVNITNGSYVFKMYFLYHKFAGIELISILILLIYIYFNTKLNQL